MWKWYSFRVNLESTHFYAWKIIYTLWVLERLLERRHDVIRLVVPCVYTAAPRWDHRRMGWSPRSVLSKALSTFPTAYSHAFCSSDPHTVCQGWNCTCLCFWAQYSVWSPSSGPARICQCLSHQLKPLPPNSSWWSGPSWPLLGTWDAQPPFLNFPLMPSSSDHHVDRPSCCPNLVQIPHHLKFSLTWTASSCTPPTLFSAPDLALMWHLWSPCSGHGTPGLLCVHRSDCTQPCRASLCSSPYCSSSWHPRTQDHPVVVEGSGKGSCEEPLTAVWLHHSLCLSFLVSTVRIKTEPASRVVVSMKQGNTCKADSLGTGT